MTSRPRTRIPSSPRLGMRQRCHWVHFSQLGPLGLNKVITFEVLCRSLQIEPTVTLFRVFQTLCKLGDWFSFAKRHAPSPVCIDDNRSCMKHWKSGFFLIDRRAIPDAIVCRHLDVAIDDPRPAAGSFNMADVRRLSSHGIKLRDMPEGVLVLSGLSRVWKSRVCDPVLRGVDGNVMGIHDFLCLPEWIGAEVQEEPHLDDLTVATPISKIVANAKASQKRKASTSGATSSHVAKRTRYALAQSSGSTTRPSLFVGDDDESDDDDACVEISLVTPLRSAAVIPSSGNQESQGKGIMVDDAAALSADFFPFFAGPYYATYLEDGVAGNCEFTREEWDAPYRPTFRVLTKEVFKDPAICKTIVDQFPTPGEMVQVESLSDDQLTAKMSVLHCMMMSHGGELLARYRGLNQSHHEYVLSTDSRLKGYDWVRNLSVCLEEAGMRIYQEIETKPRSLNSTYLVPSDAEAPIEDQPLPDDALPTSLSPGYVAESDPKEDPEENPEEDPAEYPSDEGEDGDDEEDEEAEDHLALVDYTALHIVDPISSAKDTEAFETDESAPTPPRSPRLRRAGISVQPQTPMTASTEALIAKYVVALTPPSPPPSPLTLLSSLPPQIPSPALPLPSPPTHTSPAYAEAPLGYRAARIRLRAALPSTHLPLEIPSPPLLLPSTTHRDDIPEADMPLWKRACFSTPASNVDYGFIKSVDASIRAAESRAMTTIGEVNERVTDLAATQRQDAQELYVRCEDEPAMEAQIRALQRDVDVLQRQMIRDEDRLTSHILHKHDKFRELVHTTKAGPQDGPVDAGSVEMVMIATIQELVAEGQSELLIKFATCTLLGSALTWWNSHVKIVGHDAADIMLWKTLKKMMTVKYCPRGEIKKLEIELWNQKVKGTDVLSYNQRFQDLALMCSRMYPEELDEVEKYVGGLPDMIQGSVMASKPKTMQVAIEFATELMDQKIRSLADRQAESKRNLMTLQGTTRTNSSISKGIM
ncbi:ribonuclease H-like domain-containing protein [Tanacetum coccineum]